MLSVKKRIKNLLANLNLKLGYSKNPYNLDFRNSVLTQEEYYGYVRKMNHNIFDFSESEMNKLIEQHRRFPHLSPAPSSIKKIIDLDDTKAWNSMKTMEIVYKLPFVFAYEKDNYSAYTQTVNHLEEYGILFDEKVILDCGCGIGTLHEVLHKKYPGASLHGFEFIQSAQNWMKKNRPYIHVGFENFQKRKISQTHLIAKADIIFCRETLEHLDKPELMIQKIEKFKKENGTLIFTVPDGEFDRPRGGRKHLNHKNFWTLNGFKSFLEKCLLNYSVDVVYTECKNAPGGRILLAICTT